MKLLIWIVLLSALSIGCKRQSKSVVKNEFEGIITYKLGYRDFKDSSYYGDTLRVFYSHGNILNIYNSKIPQGLREYTYLPSESKGYMKHGNSDTLQWFDVATSSRTRLLGIAEIDTPKKFLGYNSKTIKIIVEHHIKNISFIEFQTYVYSSLVLHVDKDYHFMSLDQVIDKAGAYYLHFDSYIEHVGMRTYDMVKIENKKLNPQIFDIDHAKIKEFKY